MSRSRGECGKELLLKESLKLCLAKPERAPPARSQLLQLIKPVLKPWQLACKPSFVSKASRLSVRVFIVTNNLYRIKNEEYYFCRASSTCCLGQHRAHGMAPLARAACRLSLAFPGLVVEAAYSLSHLPHPARSCAFWGGLSRGSPCSCGAPGPGGPWGGSGVYLAHGEVISQPPPVTCSDWALRGFQFGDEGCAAGEAAARRSQPEEAFPLATGVSRPRLDCENNSRAGQCSCILLLPCSPCLLSFVWVLSCSDLPLSALLDAALPSEHFCVSCSLPGPLIKRRRDVFQKYLAFSSDMERVARLAELVFERGSERSIQLT